MQSEKFFSIPTKCFKYVGYSDQEITSSFIRKARLAILLIFAFIQSMTSLFIIRHYVDVLASAEAFGILATGLIFDAKLVSFTLRSTQFFDLIKKLEDLLPPGLQNFSALE